MSISTRSCSSIPSCSSGSGMATKPSPFKAKSRGNTANTTADVRQNSKAVQTGWASELEERVLQYPGQAHDFIKTLLPCSAEFPDPPPVLRKDKKTKADKLVDKLDSIFARYNPEEGKEEREYPRLLKALNNLVATFPVEKKLTMVDTHGKEFLFPFDRFKEHHHPTKPDFTVSFPGKTLISKPTWQDISMVMEVKATEKEDPFPREGQTHINTVVQLAKSARNLLLAHGFLSAFVIGIYGHTVRLARFDHSCALVAPPISLKRGNGGVRLLKTFLWHFVHPLVGNPVVGCDPTVKVFDAEDQKWVESQLKAVQAKNWEKHVTELPKGRRIEVYDQETGKCVPYLLYHLVDVNGRLFSRATMVWRAIKDTRVVKDGGLVEDANTTARVKPQIVKESWRQLVRTAETEFYARLDAKIPKEQRFGLPTMEHGGDIGDFEFQWWKETQARGKRVTPSGADATHLDAAAATPEHQGYTFFSSTGSAAAHTATSRTPDRQLPEFDYPLPYPQQQTYSWRHLGGKYWHRERSHMRMVIDDVGRPLTEFNSTKELVAAMRDAIRGHQQAWEIARVLHRDVSMGNILILDEPDDGRHAGFMHDFDYSAMEPDEETTTQEGTSKEGDSNQQLKERTGTFFFMALDLLKPEPEQAALHLPRHDVESYFWVLLWVVLRHTNCHRHLQGTPGRKVCAELFKCENNPESGFQPKFMWIYLKSRLEVVDNAPLSALLVKFSQLIHQEIILHEASDILGNEKVVHLTYDAVLKIFDEALKMEGWPQDDWIPFKVRSESDLDPRTGVAPIMCDVPPGYPTASSSGRVLRSDSLLVSTGAASQGGASTSRGYQEYVPRRLLGRRHPMPAPTGGSESTGNPVSGSKRPRVDHPEPLPNPAEPADRLPKRSRSTMDPPPHPEAGPSRSKGSGNRSRGRRSGGARLQPTRSSSRLAERASEKEASGSGGPST